MGVYMRAEKKKEFFEKFVSTQAFYLRGERHELQALTLKKSPEEILAWIEDYVKEQREDARSKFGFELVQRFNDYEVPLHMTAEDVRDIILDYLNQ